MTKFGPTKQSCSYNLFLARRKSGPKPRRVIQSPTLSPGSISTTQVEQFACADSPRPVISDSSETPLPIPLSTSTTTTTSNTTLPAPNHKDGRPRNLGRGVSKPKKNTVASLLAQSRALGIVYQI